MQNQYNNQKKATSKPFNVAAALKENLILILVAIPVGSALVVAAALFFHKPYYSVSASILFEPHIPELVYTSNERYLHSFEDWMRTQAHEIESPNVLESAVSGIEKSGFFWTREDERCCQ